MTEEILAKISTGVIEGDEESTKEAVNKAIEADIGVEKILNQGLIEGMMTIGARFKKNEVFVPEVLIAARAMHAGMEIIEPLIAQAGIKPVAKVAIGTVKGDLHDIGKNLVAMMWKGAGFEVEDLGIDVPPEKFVDAVKNGATVLGISALLTTTMVAMKEIIDALQAAGVRDDVKIIIGGAPVTDEYAKKVGADAYASDAATAVDSAKELLNI